jgi:glycosyltransferase involved in cell wall biosynthesis
VTTSATSTEELPSRPGRRGWPWTPRAANPSPSVTDPPRIRLVTPSFQQGRFLEATIRSVLLQGYPNLEYVVLDGGSTDGSVAILREYAPWLTRWESRPDGGQAAAINSGCAGTDAEVLGWLNSDDRLAPGALWEVARAVRSAPGAVAWVGACRSVDDRGRLVFVNAPRGLSREALGDWGHSGQFGQPACFFSGRAWQAAGGVDPSLHFAFDVDLWLRLAGAGEFAAIDAVLAEETLHAAAKTVANRGRSLAELHLVQIRNGFAAEAMRRMADELQEWDVLRRGTAAEQLKHQVNLAMRPLLERLRRSRR